jgi:hypothetical protein
MLKSNRIFGKCGKAAKQRFAVTAALALTLLLPVLTSCVESRKNTMGPVTITTFGVSVPGTATQLQSITINPGQSPVLSWSVSGATSLSISDGTSTLSNLVAVTANSVQVSPNVTTTYSLTATGPNGTATTPAPVTTPTTPGSGTSATPTTPALATDSTVTVNVVPAPIINSFAATPTAIYTNQSATLQWSTNGWEGGLTITGFNPATYPAPGSNTGFVANLPSCTTAGTTPSPAGCTGSLQVTPSTSTLYTLTAISQSNIAYSTPVQIATVTVTPLPPPTVTLTAASSAITDGSSTYLSWTTTGATSLSLVTTDEVTNTSVKTNLTSDLPNFSGYPISPTDTTMYTLTATNLAGVQATATAEVKVTACPAPQIQTFSTKPVSMGTGGTVTFNALFLPGGTAGSTAVATIDQGIGAINGGTPATLQANGATAVSSALPTSTVFTLKVTNSCGTATTQTARVPVGSISLYAGGHESDPFSYPYQDGPALTASFGAIAGVTADASGNLYLSDGSPDNTIREITSAGVVSTVAGVVGSSQSIDDITNKAQFQDPSALAVDSAGNIYVLDSLGSELRIIWLDPASPLVNTVTTVVSGTVPGTQNSILGTANGIAVDAQQNIYVTSNQWNSILKITQNPDGTFAVNTLAGAGDATIDKKGAGFLDGTGTQAMFNDPIGITLGVDGNLYVAEGGNIVNGVGNFAVRRVTPEGVVTTIAGTGVSGTTDGPGTTAQFANPQSITSDASGTLYAVDRYFSFATFSANRTIRRITPQSDGYAVDTIIGSTHSFGTPSGPLPGLLDDSVLGIVAVPGSPASGNGDLFMGDGFSIYEAPY